MRLGAGGQPARIIRKVSLVLVKVFEQAAGLRHPVDVVFLARGQLLVSPPIKKLFVVVLHVGDVQIIQPPSLDLVAHKFGELRRLIPRQLRENLKSFVDLPLFLEEVVVLL